jgi:hypothetical protein
LGDQVGVTFQQIQKYENRKNRMSSGRLARVAEALATPVAHLYAGNSKLGTSARRESDSPAALVAIEGAKRCFAPSASFKIAMRAML